MSLEREFYELERDRLTKIIKDSERVKDKLNSERARAYQDYKIKVATKMLADLEEIGCPEI